MDSFEKEFEAAIWAKDSPGAVLTAYDLTGKLHYSKSFGPRYLDDANSPPLAVNSVFWMASCTKLMTTVAAMQAVERGLFTLDEDVTRILPEYKDVEILKGFEEGSDKPILEKSTRIMTLRQLLSHSSGIGYDHFNPVLHQYRAWQGISPDFKAQGKTSDNYFYPLSFEPGTSWEYGAGIDWAGIMTQRANGNISLEEYMRKNIWEPLDMVDTSFHLEIRPDLRARMVDMSEREGGADPLFGIPLNENGKMTKNRVHFMPDPVEDEAGGAGAYSTPSDYQKLLHSLCANDGKVLKKETVDEMFKPQLSEASKAALNGLLEMPQMTLAMGSPLDPGSQVDYGLGGMINLEQAKYGKNAVRTRGSMCWSGLPNMFWWMDRHSGVYGTYFSQLVPLGDQKTNKRLREFEISIYERLQRPSL